MKIAFIGGRDIHLLGGIENYMYHLATELQKRGHEPVVYCESDRNAAETVNGFLVVHCKSVGGRFLCKILLSYRATLRSLWHREHFDVYHYNAWPPALSSWLPRLCGKPALLQGHGLEWKRTKYSAVQQCVMHFMEWFSAKTNNHLIMVSEEQTQYFRKHYHKDCTTIPTATNLPPASVESDILVRYGIRSEQYFLYLGRLVQDKNPDYLIKAFIAVGLEDKQLVIAGTNNAASEYVAELHRLAEGHKNIVFTGAVYGADKEKLLEQCYAFCLPSTIEGLAITLLEAMSYGKICIASDIPANREGLGESGVWCRYEDTQDLARQLDYTAKHFDDIRWQQAYNRERILKHFTWDKITDLYLEYLHSIVR